MIEKVRKFKYLGVWSNDQFNLSTQISSITSKLSSVAEISKNIRNSVPDHIKRGISYSESVKNLHTGNEILLIEKFCIIILIIIFRDTI